MRSKNSWNKEYETKVDKNGKKHTRMVKHGMKPSKKSLAFSKHVNKMKLINLSGIRNLVARATRKESS